MERLFQVEQDGTPTTKNNEWYTPSRYVEAARKVMGGIDLDPASCELANRTVKAKRYYAIEDDGLKQKWEGRIWLNPPYKKDNSQPNGKKSIIATWVSTLIRHYRENNVTQAILLVTTQVDSSWFRPYGITLSVLQITHSISTVLRY